ncbi:proton-conducting transporter membrane subunit [Streptomyces sp. B93]|uniref:proton-conducting transporter transmembrane domain-containing protein n=1 Tax=Streptomyces sp. B93 TaxID=2824875 RepID=UPI001B392F9A|nr:proton-conducting transporter membrane subunit [Streptomyces sp. B93]MBQ1088855.1 NADH-quinone oxidoreductase subunit L [Streptomyces sp. B93]
MSVVLWTLIALPSVAGVLLALAGRPADRVAPAVAVTVAAAGLALACAAAVGRPAVEAPLLAGLPLGLRVDGLSALLVVTVAAVSLAVLAFAVWDIGPGESRGRFFGLMLLFSGAMLATVTAADLVTLLMAWEVMGALSWALIGYWWPDADRVRAANTAFLTTRTADLGLYLAAGAALAAGRPGSLALDRLDEAADPWLSLITAGVVVAALGKSAQLPFSFWLSRAMSGPSPVSALLHSATMVVAGAYLLLRLEPLLTASGWGGPAVAWTGAATAVLLGLVAVAQRDLKQLLAASSCAQIGFMVLAAGAHATAGGALQLMAHAAAKSLAFLAAGAWLALLGTKALPALRGAARRHRTAGVTFTVAALTLAGVPPLSLWAAKDVLLAAALEESPWLYAAGLAAAVVSAAYAVKALWFVWRPDEGPAGDRGGPTPLAAVPLAGLAVACAALTVPAFPPVRDALVRMVGYGAGTAPHTWELLASAALAVAASGAAWMWGARTVPVPHARVRGWLRDWLSLEELARAVVVRPVLGLARALAAFDDRVLDRGAEAAARGVLRLARGTDRHVERGLLDAGVDGAAHGVVRLAARTDRHVEQGLADAAVEGIASAARGLGRWARRPQTGQLHQYLAQAVAALTVLAVVLVLVR